MAHKLLVTAQYRVHVEMELDLDEVRETHEEMHESGEISTLLTDKEWEELANKRVLPGQYTQVPLAIQVAVTKVVQDNVEPCSHELVNGEHSARYEVQYGTSSLVVLSADPDQYPNGYPLVMGTRETGEE